MNIGINEIDNLSLPLAAEINCSVYITVDFIEFTIKNITTESICKVSPSYSDCAEEKFRLNAILTGNDWSYLSPLIEEVLTDFKLAYTNNEVDDLEPLHDKIYEVINDFEFEKPLSEGNQPAAVMCEETILISETDEGYELYDHEELILTDKTTDSEIRNLVHNHFDYLLDEVHPDSLYDELIYQRDLAIKNKAEYHF